MVAPADRSASSEVSCQGDAENCSGVAARRLGGRRIIHLCPDRTYLAIATLVRVRPDSGAAAAGADAGAARRPILCEQRTSRRGHRMLRWRSLGLGWILLVALAPTALA